MSKEFIQTVINNNETLVAIYLKEHPQTDINYCHEFQKPAGRVMSAIHVAAGQGNASIIKLLLDKAANPNVLTNSNRNPLQEAAAKGHVEACRLLLGHSKCTNRDKKGETAYEIAKSLSNCANPDLRKKYREIVELLKAPTFVEACRDNDLDLVKKMVEEEHVDINAEFLGSRGLDMSCYRAHYSIFQYLLSSPGINVNAADGDGLTALHSLVHPSLKKLQFPNPEKDRFTRRQMAQELINAGADVNARTHGYGATPLLHAVIMDADLIVNCLLSNGADTSLKYPFNDDDKEWRADILDYAKNHNEKIHTAVINAKEKAKQEGGFNVAKKLLPNSKTFQFSPGPNVGFSTANLQQMTSQLKL